MVAVIAAAASWEEVVVDLVVAPWEGVDGEALETISQGMSYSFTAYLQIWTKLYYSR